VKPLREAQPIAFNILGKTKIHCPAHRADGCSWTGDYNEALSHLERFCQFALVACTNRGCSLRLARQQAGMSDSTTGATTPRALALALVKAEGGATELKGDVCVACACARVLWGSVACVRMSGAGECVCALSA
jgi:hypothetical protein